VFSSLQVFPIKIQFAFLISTTNCIASNDYKLLAGKEVAVVCFDVLSPEETEKTHGKLLSLRRAVLPLGILTEES